VFLKDSCNTNAFRFQKVCCYRYGYGFGGDDVRWFGNNLFWGGDAMRSGGTLWEKQWTCRGEKWKKVSAVENKWLLRFRKLTTSLKMVYYFQKWECRVTWQIGSCGSQCFHHLFGWCWWIHGNAAWKTWKYFSEMLYYCFLLCLRLENHMVDGC